MEFPFSLLPQPLASTVTIVFIIIVGVAAALSLIDRTSQNRRKQIDEDNQTLVRVLKESVETLKEKVTDLELQSASSKKEIAELKSKNVILEEVFRGKDPATVEFQKRGLEIMAKFEESDKKIDMVVASNAQIQKNIEGLLSSVNNKLMEVLDRSTLPG